jgi:hypothetical protein
VFNFWSPLYILNINPLSDEYLTKILSHSVCCLLILVIISFYVQKFLNLITILFLIFTCVSYAIEVLLRKALPIPAYSRVFSVFSCSSFKVSGLTFRSLMYIELIFVQKQRQGSNISLLCVYIPFSQHLLLKRLSFIQHMLLASFSKIRWLDLFGFISGSSILFHWSSCLFLCQYYAVFVTVAQYYNLKSGINISSIALFEQD